MKRLIYLLFLLLSVTAFSQSGSRPRSEDVTISGTNTYTATLNTVTSLADGLTVSVRFTNANTGASTFNLTGNAGALGARDLRKNDGTVLSSGDITAGAGLDLRYDLATTQWRIVGGVGGSENIYNSDGTLTGNRAVNGGGNFLEFVNMSSLTLNSPYGQLKNPSGGVGFDYSTSSGFGTANMTGRHTNDNNSVLTMGTAAWNFYDGRSVPRGLVYAGDYSATFGDSSAVSKKYTDAKVSNTITNGVTTIAPAQDAVFDALALKQDALVSGTNIKTINGSTVLGSGDLVVGSSDAMKPFGDVYDITFDASSGSSYTDTSPNSTFTFTSGGLTVTGGNGDALNWVEYTTYYTNAFNDRKEITFTPTADGTGLAGLFVGTNSANGKQFGGIITAGVDKGKVRIYSYNTSSGLTSRATSTLALSYTNSTDIVKLTFEKSMFNYRITAVLVDGSGVEIGIPVAVAWDDPLTNGGVSSNWAPAKSSVFHFGGSQTILTDKYYLGEIIYNEVLFWGDSQSAGGFSANSGNVFGNLLRRYIPGGVTLIAGGGARATDWPNIKAQIFALKPDVMVFEIGANDAIANTTLIALEALIDTIIKDCLAQGIRPVIQEMYPVGASYVFGSLNHAQTVTYITDYNTYINTLGITVVPTHAALVSGGNLAFDAGDGIHISSAGHRVVAESIRSTIAPFVTINVGAEGSIMQTGYQGYNYNANGAGLFQHINSASGASSQATFRVKSNTNTLFANSYSSDHSTTAGLANAGFVGTDTGPLYVGAYGGSQTFNVMAGAFNTTTAIKLTISPTLASFSVPTQTSINQNARTEGWRTANSTNGTDASSSIRVSSNSQNAYLDIHSDAYTTVAGFASKAMLRGTAGIILMADGTNGITFATGGLNVAANNRGSISAAGRWRIGDSGASTALLHLAAGTATASTAPFKLTSGTNLTTAEAGAMEYNGTDLLFTPVGTNRLTVFTGYMGLATLVTGTVAVTTNGVGTGSSCIVTVKTPTGVTLTTQYQCVCTANTITIQANVAAGTINTADGSVMNYMVKP